ncbi:hypothetical protein HYX70_04795 [Candidatus Saccharibacteria bacterium]|nr:hypothetical protein [Candidatus Saccharibacteria bacterium]
MPNNTIELVKEVIADLEANGVNVLLGGGWAEERLGLKAPWAHGDIDLYYIAQNFNLLDSYIAKRNLKLHKNKPHKRAFKVNGVQVEVILIQQDEGGYFSTYQNHSDVVDKVTIRWPDNIKTACDLGIEHLSPTALRFKRKVHRQLFPESEHRA